MSGRFDKSGTTLGLPVAAHVPGKTPRPADALFDDLKGGLQSCVMVDEFADSAAFRGGIEAFDRGYFWESHELLEAVWTRLPPASAERYLVQGLIHFANACLKARMRRARAVCRIQERAEKSVTEAFLHGSKALMGVTQANIDEWRRRVAMEMSCSENAK